MKAFVDKYEDRVHGILSCFDRMLSRGDLPLMSPSAELPGPSRCGTPHSRGGGSESAGSG
jgi:hypothetical protein